MSTLHMVPTGALSSAKRDNDGDETFTPRSQNLARFYHLFTALFATAALMFLLALPASVATLALTMSGDMGFTEHIRTQPVPSTPKN